MTEPFRGARHLKDGALSRDPVRVDERASKRRQAAEGPQRLRWLRDLMTALTTKGIGATTGELTKLGLRYVEPAGRYVAASSVMGATVLGAAMQEAAADRWAGIGVSVVAAAAGSATEFAASKLFRRGKDEIRKLREEVDASRREVRQLRRELEAQRDLDARRDARAQPQRRPRTRGHRPVHPPHRRGGPSLGRDR